MSQTIYPYEHSTGLKVEILNFRLDGADSPSVVDNERKEINILDIKHSWNKMTFQIRLSDPEGNVSELFPAEESIDIRACLRIICADTEFREGYIIQREGAFWEGQITLEREKIYSSVKIDAFICRNTNRSGNDDNYASETGDRLLILGEDQYNWTIKLDTMESPQGQILKGKWKSF